jgi:uncharacterized membrane protein
MKAKVQSLWESIHTSFWFLPAVLTVLAIGLSIGTVQLDRSISWNAQRVGEFLYPGGGQGARLVLSTIAGSTITVAGVTFSITIAALTMAGSQFGPRLLRNFLADKGNQVVLGTFVGTFIYCLLVMRTIADFEEGQFIPRIAITFGIVLALASFLVLIYFFHHASSSIQAEQVVDTIFRELMLEIDHTFPQGQGPQAGAPERPPQVGRDEHAFTVLAEASGYVRVVDVEGLLALAIERDLRIQLRHRPGDFVFEGTPLAMLAGARPIDEAVPRRVRQAFLLGKYRSLKQDVEFPVQQLVDMALRALSPSLNDPYTAVNCLDRLGAAICHLNGRQPASAYRYDDQGRLRLIRDVPTYEGILDAAFTLIRQNLQRSLGVSIRLLEILQAIAVTATGDTQRQAVRLHAQMVYRAGLESLTEEKDRRDLEERFRQVMENLDGES